MLSCEPFAGNAMHGLMCFWQHAWHKPGTAAECRAKGISSCRRQAGVLAPRHLRVHIKAAEFGAGELLERVSQQPPG